VGEMNSLIKEKQNGISFKPDDTESLMNSVKFIYNHRDRMWDTRQIRQGVIRQYSWERTASRTYEIFLELSHNAGY
jgi:glycosyltransferase involved in cell wall biosynthesis